MRELLLCAPDYYGIEYEINPWMSRARGADTALVQKQWRGLYEKLVSLGREVLLVPPRPKLTDHTSPVCRSSCSCSPVAGFHTRTVWSHPPLATRGVARSGLYATA